jgi:hypothetical protein
VSSSRSAAWRDSAIDCGEIRRVRISAMRREYITPATIPVSNTIAAHGSNI